MINSGSEHKAVVVWIVYLNKHCLLCNWNVQSKLCRNTFVNDSLLCPYVTWFTDLNITKLIIYKVYATMLLAVYIIRLYIHYAYLSIFNEKRIFNLALNYSSLIICNNLLSLITIHVKLSIYITTRIVLSYLF